MEEVRLITEDFTSWTKDDERVEPKLVQLYSYICDKCHKKYGGKHKPFQIINCSGEKTNRFLCDSCVCEKLRIGSIAIHGGYAYEYGHPNVVHCRGCNKSIYLDDEEIKDRTNWYCVKCVNSASLSYKQASYCPNCGRIHKKINGVCNCGLSNNLSVINSTESTILRMETSRDSKSWSPRGERKLVSGTEEKNPLLKLPFQEERELPEDVRKALETFYHNEGNSKEHLIFSTYYYREPINIEGTVSYKRYDGLKKFKELLLNLESFSDTKISKGKKQSKYRNYFFKDISEDGLITWDYVDAYGNVKQKKESINVFLNDNGVSDEKVSLSRNIYYKLSSNIYHKLKAFTINSKFGSCQQSHNSTGLASGAYDSITNGCNCPILLYNNKGDEDPIGRITSRIMYDNDGNPYILIERLYQDGSLGNQKLKGEMYKLIIQDLKRQGYKVIVSNYSAHDSSTLQYIRALGIDKTVKLENLYQPLRKLYNVHGYDGICGYYCDSGTEVKSTNINGLEWSTDYLDKAFMIV